MPITRLLRILTILAVLLAPLGMLGGHPAMATPAPSDPAMSHMAIDPAGHCADIDKQSKDQPGSSIDCMIACSVLLTAENVLSVHPVAISPRQPRTLAVVLNGLHPEWDTPPPRLS